VEDESPAPSRGPRRPVGREWLDVARFLAAASLAYALSSLKNCVKFLIGRKTYYNDRDLFFRQYLFQLLGIRPIRRITCPGLRGEGPGSQALMMMHAISFARASGLTYVHTPFDMVANPDRPIEEWAAAWEEHFNLGAGEAVFDGRRQHAINYAYNFPQLELCFGWSGARRDKLTEAFNATIPDFKRKYHANKAVRGNHVLTVWVQVRRGEITPSQHAHMWTNTSFIAETITMVRKILDTRGVRYRTCVFSQGRYEDIAELDTPGTEIFLNRDPIWSMEQAVGADILIMARSSFSYVSALLSDGIKICEDGGYPPLSGWVLRGPGSNFDGAAFERQLEQLLESRRNRGYSDFSQLGGSSESSGNPGPQSLQ